MRQVEGGEETRCATCSLEVICNKCTAKKKTAQSLRAMCRCQPAGGTHTGPFPAVPWCARARSPNLTLVLSCTRTSCPVQDSKEVVSLGSHGRARELLAHVVNQQAQQLSHVRVWFLKVRCAKSIIASSPPGICAGIPHVFAWIALWQSRTLSL